MPEPPSAPQPPRMIDLPPVPPLGGSKWARGYAGPRRAVLAAVAWRRVAGAVLHPDGRVTEDDAAVAEDDAAVLALPAGRGVTLGQFLTGPLAAAYEAKMALPPRGGALSPRQTDVLAKLGVLRGYAALAAPCRFAEVTEAVISAGAPGGFGRKLADFLRGRRAGEPTRVAILPRRETEAFCLTNRASLTAWLRAKQVTVLDPETTRFSELVAALAGARLVLLADPLQAGLLGLCGEGAKVLEIAPEGWLGAEARVMCSVFGLEWAAFLAAPPSYPLQGALPFGSLVPCGYEVGIRELAKAMEK